MELIVNGDPFRCEEGTTVTELLEQKKYSYPLKTVYIGETRIPKDQWDQTVLRPGEVVRVIHLMAGG